MVTVIEENAMSLLTKAQENKGILQTSVIGELWYNAYKDIISISVVTMQSIFKLETSRYVDYISHIFSLIQELWTPPPPFFFLLGGGEGGGGFPSFFF